MSFKQIKIISAIFLLVITSNLSAAIYKWKDEAGQVHYGSMPPQGTQAEKMGVSTTFTAAPAKQANSKGGDKQGNQPANGKKPEDDGYTQKQHDTVCKNARKDLETMNKSGRLRVKQDDGSSSVMTDKQRQERIKSMQAMVKKHCK